MERIDLRTTECPECKGDGRDPKKKKRLCPVCRGHGKIASCRECGKPATRGWEDASGKYRISEDDVCKCYEGVLF